MRRMLLVAMLLLFIPVARTQDKTTHRFYLSNSSVPSGKILEGIQEHCQSVVLSIDQSKADYTLEAQYDTDTPNPSTVLTLFDKNGDALFQTQTRKAPNAVKDICAFLKLEK